MHILRALLFFLLLMTVGFFVGGTIIAFTIERPAGLAGAGIAAFWALLGAFAGLTLAIFAFRKASVKQVIRINVISVFAISLLIAMLMAKKAYSAYLNVGKLPYLSEISIFQSDEIRSLGLARPDFYNSSVLYFYHPNLDKAVDEHSPTDSLVFLKTEVGYEISYAPPWYFPQHMKMDYGILLHKIITVGRDWIEIEVNQATQQTAWMDATQLTITFWPSFLLSINSLESLDKQLNPVKIKPLDHASNVSNDYSLLKPKLVKGEWIKVDLMDEDYTKLGEGWIRWKRDGRWLISYSLLS